MSRHPKPTALDENAAWLRRAPLFSHMEAAKLRMLAFASERVELAEGEFLFRQGEMIDAAYVIVEGDIGIIYEDEGVAQEIWTMQAGDLVGELALFTDAPCLTGAKAKSPLLLLRISKTVFFHMLQEFPEIAVGVATGLADGLRRAIEEFFRLQRIVRQLDPDRALVSPGER